MTAAGHAAPEEFLSIGAVIERLRPEFSDLTVSKVRFLETEGLVTPSRTPSGYRRFGPADVERLRYVLAAQRDRYLPLKVIREELERLDVALASEDAVAALPTRRSGGPRGEGSVGEAAEPGEACLRSGSVRRLTREMLAAGAEVSTELVDELVEAGLVTAGPGGFFEPEAVEVARIAHQLAGHGVSVRHLRAVRTAADRQADLIARVVDPEARRGDPDARDRATELAREVAALSLTLHSTLVTVAVRRALGD